MAADPREDSGSETADITDFLDSTVAADDEDTLPLLASGDLSVIGRMPFSSNATFLVDVRLGEHRTQAIYKPQRGERPLHDFPPGLWKREVAAYELSALTGWDLVPPTVARQGPLGEGSVQLFCPSDYSEHYLTLRDEDRHQQVLRRLCAFDVVINNTDRKSGHVLAGHSGRLWAIDNGLSFHVVTKVRTVIWDFGGTPLDDDISAVVSELSDRDLTASLGTWLDPVEIEATRVRSRRLADIGSFPVDVGGRAYPWPLV